MNKDKTLLIFEQMAKVLQDYVQTYDDDAKALEVKLIYPPWESCIGKTVNAGFKFTYEDDLYKTTQPTLTIAGHYIPGQGTESLYTKIDETHAGTIDDPIPYETNMEIFSGKYYTQNEVLYLCTRDSGQPLYHDLSALVGVYVEVVS